MLSPFVKNLHAYRFSRPQDFPALIEQLHTTIPEFTYVPCAYGQTQKLGYVPVLGESYVHAASGALFLCLKAEARKVPKPNLMEELDRVAAVQEEQIGRKLTRQERNTVKEAVHEDLLEKAFPKRSTFYVIIDTLNSWVIIGGASTSLVEAGLALLRKTLGSLPIVPFETQKRPCELMTNWVRHEPPAPFELGEKLAFADAVKDNKARVQYEELVNDITLAHLDKGELVIQLQLYLQKTCEFTLAENCVLSGIKWEDNLRDQNMDEFDELARFDADCILMVNNTRDLLLKLLLELGGLQPLAHEKEVDDAPEAV